MDLKLEIINTSMSDKSIYIYIYTYHYIKNRSYFNDV